MPDAVESDVEERRKQSAALQRAVPITRMVDYGVPLGDALWVHAAVSTDDPPAWDDACEPLALRHVGLARAASSAGYRLTAALAWRSASALLQCAQLAYNADGPRKQALYEQTHAAMQQHAALCDDLQVLRLPTALGDLHAWSVHPPQPAQAAVIVLGGLSGWGASYLDMGRALAARGMLALLCEGPGQGLSRMHAGIHLGADTLPLLSRFVDHAQSLLDKAVADRIGVWGNSFGGLFAAQLAVRDARVQALCFNGTPGIPITPDFKTARELLGAVLGTMEKVELVERASALMLDPLRHRTAAAMLVVEGGRDPVVPLGLQLGFFDLSSSAEKSRLSWGEGEHTVHNHAPERNSRVADWFAQHLQVTPR